MTVYVPVNEQVLECVRPCFSRPVCWWGQVCRAKALQKPFSHPWPVHLEMISSSFKLYPDLTTACTTNYSVLGCLLSWPTSCMLPARWPGGTLEHLSVGTSSAQNPPCPLPHLEQKPCALCPTLSWPLPPPRSPGSLSPSHSGIFH